MARVERLSKCVAVGTEYFSEKMKLKEIGQNAYLVYHLARLTFLVNFFCTRNYKRSLIMLRMNERVEVIL